MISRAVLALCVAVAHISGVAAIPHRRATLENCVSDVLKTNVTQRLIKEDNELYTDARMGEKIQFDQFPSMIAFVEKPEEVAPLVKCAKEAGIKAVPRSGGHHFEAFSALNESLVLDIAHLDSITVSDDVKTATVGAGIRLGPLYTALDEYNTTFAGGICPTVALGGFISSGGFNMQMRTLGLSANQVLSAKVVTADGETLTVSEEENSDLFWAIRGGGGGTFGIVTEYEVTLTKMPKSAMVVLNWKNSSSMYEISKRFLDWAPKQPEELTTQLNIYQNSITLVGWFYGRDQETLHGLFNESGLLEIGGPKFAIDGGCGVKTSRNFGYGAFECFEDDISDTAILNTIQHPFSQFQDYPQFAYKESHKSQAIPSARPWERNKRYSKSFFIQKDNMADDETIHGIVDRFNDASSSSQIFGEWHSWNITCPEDNSNAFGWCENAWAHLQFTLRGAEDSEERNEYDEWLDDFESFLRPKLGPASYSGYMDSGISVDPLTSYYGNNTCRLIEVKKKYDPKGFFENPMSIPTSSPDGIDCED